MTICDMSCIHSQKYISQYMSEIANILNENQLHGD